jgi:hypothetical protein
MDIMTGMAALTQALTIANAKILYFNGRREPHGNA